MVRGHGPSPSRSKAAQLLDQRDDLVDPFPVRERCEDEGFAAARGMGVHRELLDGHADMRRKVGFVEILLKNAACSWAWSLIQSS